MKNLLIKPNSSIKNALRQMTKTGEKCLVVVNKKNSLLGTLSDGDLRKAIINGKIHNDKINDYYQKRPTFLRKENYSINQAKNIFLKKRIEVIPITTGFKTVVDVITFENIFKNRSVINTKTFSNTVVIMAGGKGTRLEPFTHVLPKPLVPINEKPVIDHIIDKFVENKVSNFIITTNYKSKILKAYFQEIKPKYKLHFVEEPTPLGTAGGLRLLKGKVKKPFIVTNCDTIININLDNLIKFHISNENDITLAVSSKQHMIPYGTVKLTKKGHLKEILEKPKFNFFVNVGLYVLNPNLIKLIPKNKLYDMTDLLKHAKFKKKKIVVYPIDDGSWIDVGQWSEYRKSVDRLT
jgi:dTDP-glucose pyrophosphorylase|tara:strand:+ start:9242 stop:10294 length:1053 start_codon:yes stop_codon:yes gene_type:complete